MGRIRGKEKMQEDIPFQTASDWERKMHQMKSHPLKVARELRGWSQAKLAEEIGTTSRSVSRWEQGLALPYPHSHQLKDWWVLEKAGIPQKE